MELYYIQKKNKKFFYFFVLEKFAIKITNINKKCCENLLFNIFTKK